MKNALTFALPRRGFTLIELLIVIGILAVLATLTVLVINPAELFRQARDTQRVSDMAAMRSAVNFTIGTGSPTWSATAAYTSSVASPTTLCNGAPQVFTSVCDTSRSGLTATNGTGWLAVSLASAAGGSPLARLPLDPTNDGTHFYVFKSTVAGLYKIATILESTKYATTQDLDGLDGGSSSTFYEVGNSLTPAF